MPPRCLTYVSTANARGHYHRAGWIWHPWYPRWRQRAEETLLPTASRKTRIRNLRILSCYAKAKGEDSNPSCFYEVTRLTIKFMTLPGAKTGITSIFAYHIVELSVPSLLHNYIMYSPSLCTHHEWHSFFVRRKHEWPQNLDVTVNLGSISSHLQKPGDRIRLSRIARRKRRRKKKLLGGGGTWHYQYTPTHKDGLFQTRAHTHAEKEKRKKIKATPIVTRQFSRSPSWVWKVLA